MVKEAVERLGGKATSADIRKYLRSTYDGVNENSVSAHVTLCTVNSRPGFTIRRIRSRASLTIPNTTSFTGPAGVRSSSGNSWSE
jgi:hypothetical protein